MENSQRIQFSVEGFGDYDLEVGTPLRKFLQAFTSDVGIRLESASVVPPRKVTQAADTPLGEGTEPYGTANRSTTRFPTGASTNAHTQVAGRWPFVSGACIDLESINIVRPPLSIADTDLLFEQHVLVTGARGFSIQPVTVIPGLNLTAQKVRFGFQQARTLASILPPASLPRWLMGLVGAFLTARAYTVGVPLRDATLIKLGRKRSITYAVRDGMRPPRIVDHHVKESPSRVAADSTSPSKFPLLPIVIPLALSIVLASVMRQPLFLLFALSSPLLMIAQHFSTRRSQPSAEPSWVESGLSIQDMVDFFLVLSAYNARGAALPEVPTIQGKNNTENLSGLPDFTPTTSKRGLASLKHTGLRSTVYRLQKEPSAEHTILLSPTHNDELKWLRWLPVFVRVNASNDSQSMAALAPVKNMKAIQLHTSSAKGPTDRRVLTLLPAEATSGSQRQQAGQHPNELAQNCSFHWYPLASLEELASRAFAEQWRLRNQSVGTHNPESYIPAVVPFEVRQTAYQSQSTQSEFLSTTNARPSGASSFELRLGIREGAQIRLDLDKVGPHVLVAGTTGSGKSEFLQALIFDAALEYSSQELNLVLFDYKGGAGLGQANKLPHAVGMVTDFDPSQVSRALDGLHNELRRREELFSEANVVKLSDYNAQANALARLPRVLIVVDEFRAIADDHQDFVQRIVRLAAQGRSLGLYLILATQRPAGAITPEIRANVPVRVCLRVADEQDSLDVLGTKDAAYLPHGMPGRFFVSTGASSVLLGQSFYLRATQTSESFYRPLSFWHSPLPRSQPEAPSKDSEDADDVIRSITKTIWASHGLGSVKVYNSRSADSWENTRRKFGIAPASPLWAGALPQVFSPEEESDTLAPGSYRMPGATALAALPNARFLTSLTWLDHPGNLLVQGLPLSGKTTALIACARTVTPDNIPVGIHWIGKPQEKVLVQNHVATAGHELVNYVDAGDPVKTHAVLLALLNNMDGVARRSNILLIDDFESMRSSLESFDRGSGMMIFESMLRSAGSSGTRVAISTSRGVGVQLRNQFTQYLVLASGDSGLDASTGISRKLLPLPAVKGRAVWTTSEHSFHCQVAFNTPAVYQDQAAAKALPDPRLFADLRVESLGEIQESDFGSMTRPGVLITGFRAEPLRDLGITHLVMVDNDPTNRAWAAQTLGDSVFDLAEVETATDLQALRSLTTSSGVVGPSSDVIWLKNLTKVAPHLEVIVQELLRDLGSSNCVTVVVDCSATEFNQAFRGPLAEVKSDARVLLLQPRFGIDREFAGTSIVTAVEVSQFPGKAVLIENGYAHPARIVRSFAAVKQ